MCVTSRRSGCLHLVCVWITGPSRGSELCLVLGAPDWRAWQGAKHWFLIDTLNSQTDCTTSGHEQNSMHNSKPQANREALSFCHLPVLILRLILYSTGRHFCCVVWFSFWKTVCTQTCTFYGGVTASAIQGRDLQTVFYGNWLFYLTSIRSPPEDKVSNCIMFVLCVFVWAIFAAPTPTNVL